MVIAFYEKVTISLPKNEKDSSMFLSWSSVVALAIGSQVYDTFYIYFGVWSKAKIKVSTYVCVCVWISRYLVPFVEDSSFPKKFLFHYVLLTLNCTSLKCLFVHFMCRFIFERNVKQAISTLCQNYKACPTLHSKASHNNPVKLAHGVISLS